jgi:Gas vesicle synthesis protein GvpL/GvpF
MALAVPRIRPRLSVSVASRRARSLAWRLRMWNRWHVQASCSKQEKAKAAAQREAKTLGSQQDKGIYVYGILPADIEMAAEMAGVRESPELLRVVRCDGLAALISEVDLSGRLESPEDLQAHSDILDATAAEVPVLPLRFGVVLTSENAVAEALVVRLPSRTWR